MYPKGNIHTAFIGKPLSVCEASNAHYVGLAGTIVDETKNSFRIETDTGVEKVILKKGTCFLIEGNLIPGNEITKRLEDRIKNRRSKQWKN